MSACVIKDCGAVQGVRSGGVCDDCWITARRNALNAIPNLWLGLHSHLPRGSRGPSEPIARQPAGSRSPLSDVVMDALRSVPMDLAQWATACLAASDREPLDVTGKRWGYVLSEAVGTLAAWDDSLRYGQDAPVYVSALITMRTRLLHLNGLERLVHYLPAPCPDCRRRGLVRHNGRDVVLCPQCGGRWSEPEYRRHVLSVLRAAESH